MSIVLYVVLAILFLSFLAIVFVGAPYVPTHQRDIEAFFKLMKLGSNDVLVDLGSGDGRMMLSAAKKGIPSVGYELNPFLTIITAWRLRRYRQIAQVRTVDFWQTSLPPGTTVVFTFLASPFMKRLAKYMQQQADLLGHDVRLVSYGFELSGLEIELKKDPFVVYRFEASK